MAMQFNPQTAFLRGMDLGSPATSQGGINNLLNMQQATLGGMVDSFGNIGKTSRTNTVNDLIARGGLEGLNEAQTQARIQQEAGGTLTPEGQANVDKLLQTTGKQDQRKFTTEERLGGEKFLGGEHEKTATAKLLAEQTKATADKMEADRKYENDVKEFGIETALKNRIADETKRSNKSSEGLTARGQYKPVQGADGMWYNATPEGKLTKLVGGILPAHATDGSGGKAGEKLTGEIRKMWDNSTGKGKLALEEMYKEGTLQAVPIMSTDPKTQRQFQSGQKLLYEGKPTTIRQLREHLGLK